MNDRKTLYFFLTLLLFPYAYLVYLFFNHFPDLEAEHKIITLTLVMIFKAMLVGLVKNGKSYRPKMREVIFDAIEDARNDVSIDRLNFINEYLKEGSTRAEEYINEFRSIREQLLTTKPGEYIPIKSHGISFRKLTERLLKDND